MRIGGAILNSFIGWIGGKKALRDQIIALFPKQPPKRYIEVCGGAGWIFFHKGKVKGQLEVFNDVNGQLVNLYRCIKYHDPELRRWTEDIPLSRELFEDFKAQENIRGLTDIQRAVRYLYLIKASFGSNRRSFATSGKGTVRLTGQLPEVSERLRGVLLENKDFEDLIKAYDRPDAFFYIDPPYVGSEKLYDTPFQPSDHKRLFETLKQIQGKFLLSYNDCPEVRNLYAGYEVLGLSRKNLLDGSGGNTGDFKEVAIRNYNA